jgi:hypothetical protein
MSDHYTVAAQGINEELTKANGEYEAQELGPKTVAEIGELLERLAVLTCPDPKSDDDDLCPPSLHCEKDGEVFAFVFNGGPIFSVETGGDVTVDEAMAIFSDTSTLDELSKRARIANAPDAVLKTDIAPTDTEKVTVDDIDTGSKAPQFSLDVWKSGNARSYTFAPPAIGGFFLFVGLVALKRDPKPAVICLVIGVVCLFLRRFVKPWARETLSIGIDWATNTIWAKRGKKKLSFQPDANRFAEFSLEKKRDTEALYHDFDGDGIVQSQNVKVVTWVLEAKTSGSDAYSRKIAAFVSKKEGQEALAKLKQLYTAQK